MKLSAFAIPTVFAAISMQACVITTDDSTFILDNQSDYAIYEAYLAEVNAPSWGPELLGGEILLPGGTLEVRNVACGNYDALIYDELGAECEILDLDLCFDDAVWVIDNFELSTCPIFR